MLSGRTCSGELEDEWAGEPGKRLRERYTFAARYSASSGIATCLVINDMDAGVGRFANTGEGMQIWGFAQVPVLFNTY